MCFDPSSCPRHRAISLPQPGADFFAEMSMRLRDEGGLVSMEALQARLHQQGKCLAEVEQWLACGKLRSVAWGRQNWLPAFQLTEGGALRPDVAVVADELAGTMDDLEILAWFACPNEALDGRTPLVSLRSGLQPVLDAARIDHFLTSA